MTNILVIGYTYIRDSQRNTFNHYPGKVFFLLPKIWKIKGGKVVFRGPKQENIFLVNTYFNHSQYPIVGGLLKGWMPALPLVLLKSKIKGHKLGLVYSGSEPTLLTTLYNGFWAKVFGLKHVAFSWENIPYEHKYSGLNIIIKKLILRLSLFFSDGLLCGNQKCADIHRAYTAKPMAVLPMNGLDPEFFKRHNVPKIFRDFDFSGKVIFTFVGAIGWRKGIHIILEAFPKVLEQIPFAHVIIAGSGEDDAKIDDLIQKLNLSSYVTRIPWIDYSELTKLLSVSDMFLYPSFPYKGWEEQFGYAMAEASLMELPVISTHSGSIEDVVIDSQTGILVEPNNQEQLREAMLKLGQDAELRHQLGQAGRRYIIENFSNQIIAQKFHNFFEGLI